MFRIFFEGLLVYGFVLNWSQLIVSPLKTVWGTEYKNNAGCEFLHRHIPNSGHTIKRNSSLKSSLHNTGRDNHPSRCENINPEIQKNVRKQGNKIVFKIHTSPMTDFIDTEVKKMSDEEFNKFLDRGCSSVVERSSSKCQTLDLILSTA